MNEVCMPNEKSIRLAEQILDDLHGSAYYADPAVLGNILATVAGAERGIKTEDAAKLLGQLAHRYIKRHGSDNDDKEELASWLQALGID